MANEIDNIITGAINLASEQKHEYVTLEHLMYCLLEDEDVVDLLETIECDWPTAKEDLKNYLQDPEQNNLI